MCNSPFVEQSETMFFMDYFKKAKRLRLFEPSIRILGFFFVTVCVIFCFFLLNYRSVAIRFSSQNERFLWLRFGGGGSIESRKKVDYLSENNGGCDVFEGDWVWDDSYPLYQSRNCSFLDEGFKCSENGRPDFFYTKWRWQPKDCNLPRFNAKIMLEKLRNKRLVFVGDSIGRNQWESLLCMLSSAIFNKDSIYEVNGNPITKHKGFLVFKFMEYNCTVEYYRAPFLVLQSRPPANISSKIKTTIKLDQMDWTSMKWKDADVLVFNTGHWWNYEKTIRGGCYFQEGSEVKMGMRVETAYRKSLETVVEWINREVNTTKTQVFFRTYAPVHFSETEAMDVDAPPASEVDISPERLEAFKAALGRYRYAQHIEQISIADIEGIVHRREPVPYSTAEIMSLLELSTDNARERQLVVGQEYECSVLI